MRSERFVVSVDGQTSLCMKWMAREKERTETLKHVVSKLKDAELKFFVLFDKGKGIARKCDEPSYVREQGRGSWLHSPRRQGG